ncbi:hypothetical protein [Streptomyces sp. HUAS TT7]|uniref:hypothetical protein n=1 Tax=Streptomyces sp. HUAS TT7 TaxID=3447507 RepID=UPI003F654DF2
MPCLDDNVRPQFTMRLVDRPIAADKDFGLLIVPGAEHICMGYEHYVTRRRGGTSCDSVVGAR